MTSRARATKWIFERSRAFFFALSLALVFAIGVPASGQERQQVGVELIADTQTIEPGKTFRLGVLFTMPEHGHIYWRFPGSSGLATGIEWELPVGFEVSELYWPAPSRFEIKSINDITYGYEKEVLLFRDVTPPADFEASGPIVISADPYWLVCLESGQCIPESKGVRLELSAGDSKASKEAETFERYASRVPTLLDKYVPISIATGIESGDLHLESRTPWRFVLDEKDSPARFFPDGGDPWELSHPRSVKSDREISVEFQPVGKTLGRLAGVATLPMRNLFTKEKKTFYVRIGSN